MCIRDRYYGLEIGKCDNFGGLLLVGDVLPCGFFLDMWLCNFYLWFKDLCLKVWRHDLQLKEFCLKWHHDMRLKVWLWLCDSIEWFKGFCLEGWHYDIGLKVWLYDLRMSFKDFRLKVWRYDQSAHV